MSSRQEEKQRRREERLARERAEKARAARRQRLQIAGGVLAGVAVVAVGILLVAGVIGGGASGNDEVEAPAASENVTLPEPKIGDLRAAAKAAKCKLANPPIEGRGHETKDFKASDYKTNPPTSGNHYPDWYQDGVYDPGGTPNLGMLVHTLEHGRIDVQYKPGTPQDVVAKLNALLAEQNDGYHMLLFENTTGMKAQIAATAWGHSLTCPQFNDQVFDAIRTFRNAYIDKGPEQVP